MPMSKNHYEAIAAVVNLEATDITIRTEKDVAKNIALGLCHVFENDNPRFDKDLFLTACGF